MTNTRPGILNTLIHRINSFSEGYRQNIAIIGEPHTGKTSLIKNILSSSEVKKEWIIPIYLEIKIEPFEYCAKRFIKSALFQLLQSDPLLTTPPDTLLLIEDLQRSYPKTAQLCMRVLQDIEKNRLDEAFSFMLDIPATIFEESKKRCVLILDEFHNIENFTLKKPFGALAKKIMIQKDTMYLFLSSKSTVSHRLINEKLSMLFGNFEKLVLPPYHINMSRVFLRERVKAVNFPQIHLDYIASFTGNKPLYMQIICDEIERAIFCKKHPQRDHAKLIESAMTETIFKKTGIINQLFLTSFFKISNGKFLSKSAAVLIALSSKNKKQQAIAKASKLSAREVSKILNRLTEMDIIARNGSFYNFKDKLFRFWLQSVYLKRILSFSIDEQIEEDYFKKGIMNRFEVFIQESNKELSAKIIDLFKLFKNDIIQLNGKKHKFIPFSQVEKIDRDPASYLNILAQNDKFNWLCTVKKDYIAENDITKIIENTKSPVQNNRINRHVLLCLSGIDENAYLVAKEAKLWVWDIEGLNTLMELYGKPYISL